MIIRAKIDNFVAHSEKIAVVGLGYVGLPLAVHLSHHFSVIGFDVKDSRIEELRQGFDQTLEITIEQLKAAAVTFTNDPSKLAECRMIIVAVPTPIDGSRIPDLSAIRGASTRDKARPPVGCGQPCGWIGRCLHLSAESGAPFLDRKSVV